MIVCLCRNITEQQIRKAVREGMSTMPALNARLGVAIQCGRCHEYAEDLLQQCKKKIN